MAETVKKQYLDKTGLNTFWQNIKTYVDAKDAPKISEVLAGNGIEVTGKNTVAVKYNNAGGNVKFTADVTNGLSANVTIPEATVTGVKADDKFLSLILFSVESQDACGQCFSVKVIVACMGLQLLY